MFQCVVLATTQYMPQDLLTEYVVSGSGTSWELRAKTKATIELTEQAVIGGRHNFSSDTGLGNGILHMVKQRRFTTFSLDRILGLVDPSVFNIHSSRNMKTVH